MTIKKIELSKLVSQKSITASASRGYATQGFVATGEQPLKHIPTLKHKMLDFSAKGNLYPDTNCIMFSAKSSRRG